MTSKTSIMTRTWVAVFDGGRASAFENEGFDDAPNLRFLFGARNENRSAHDLGRDKPGRFETPMGGRTAVVSPDPHEKSEARFVDSFLSRLEVAAAAERFDRLVALAPAALLHRLREKAPKAAEKLAASQAADLAHAPLTRIEQAFLDALSA